MYRIAGSAERGKCIHPATLYDKVLAIMMITQIMPSDPLSAFLVSDFSERRKRLREISDKIQRK